MTAIRTRTLSELYEKDETAWLESMARLVRRRALDELDHRHLAEFLTDTARRDRREVESRMATLIAHLLKWRHQPEKRTRSWQVTAELERQELLRLFASKTLRNHAQATLAATYADGVRLAAAETGLPKSTFAMSCPGTLAELLEGLSPDAS